MTVTYERLREFAMNAPTCELNEDSHYGFPKPGMRWRCLTCNEWCYPESPGMGCIGCEAREIQADLLAEAPA